MPDAVNYPWDNGGPAITGMGVQKDLAPQTQEEAIGAARADQEAYDKLGPQTRAAMKNSPVRWSAAQILGMAQGRPGDPRIDAMIAGEIRRHEPKIVEAIRVSDADAIAKSDPRTAIQKIIDRAEARRKTAA